MSADAVDAAESVFEFEPEIEMEMEMDVNFLDYLEKPAEVETAATFGFALRQKSCWGSSAVAEIELRTQDAVWKDLKSTYPEVQRQPQLGTYLIDNSPLMDQALAATKD